MENERIPTSRPVPTDSPVTVNIDYHVTTGYYEPSTSVPKIYIFLNISILIVPLVLLPTFIQAWRIINRRRKGKQQHSLGGGEMTDVEVNTMTDEGNADENNEDDNAATIKFGTIERMNFCSTFLIIILAFVHSIIVHSSSDIFNVDDRQNYSIGFWSFGIGDSYYRYGKEVHYYDNSPYTIRIDPAIQYAASLDIIITLVTFLLILRCIIDNCANTGKVKTKGLTYSLLLASIFHINSLISLSLSGLCRNFSHNNDDNINICSAEIGFAYATIAIIYWFLGAIGVTLSGMFNKNNEL